MLRGQRLRKNSEFDTAYAQGKTWADNLLVLKVLPNGLQHNRYGFVAGKRVGNAVVRNRVKRRLREAMRSVPAKEGWDIVVIARGRAAGASYQQLRGSLIGLLRRAHIHADRFRSGGMGKAEG
jgi:ribonuclease P protein component